MASWVWVVIVLAALVVVAVIAMAARQRRTAELRQRFGPEYDRAVEAREDRRSAEAELRDRERQRARLDIRPLPEGERARYAQEWRDVQERFVDQPSEAVVAADALVYSVMDARGYPMGDFDAQAALVSVDYPGVVENYRYAHDVRGRAEAQQASTEDLREALLRYRSLFGELLGSDDAQVDAATAGNGAGNAVGAASGVGAGNGVGPVDPADGDLDPTADDQNAVWSPDTSSRED